MAFRNDENGNVAIMLALSLLPLMMLLVFGVEFNRQQSHEREAASALDATVLAVARERQRSGGTQESLTVFAQTYFDSIVPAVRGLNYQPLILETMSDQQITLSVDGSMPSALLSILGADRLDFSVLSSAGVGTRSQLEVMLVVDISNSMDGPNIVALRNAVEAMVDEVLQPGNPDIRMGMVPFNNYVNVGLANRDAPWISVEDDRVETRTACRTDREESEDLGCTFRQICDADGQLGSGSEGCHTRTTCPAGVDAVQTCEMEEQDYLWLGCVGSRDRPLNLNDSNFNTDPALGLLMRSYWNCEEENELLELTDDANAIKMRANMLDPGGTTYMAPGIVWGRRALSSGVPFDTARFSGVPNTQSIILLSDGANIRSKNPSNEWHETFDTEQANEDTLAACEAAKEAGIILYTIDFGVDDSTTENLLRSCASNADLAFEADSANQLVAVFEGISSSFNEVVLTR